MNCERSYCHMLNQLAAFCEQLDNLQHGQEQINVAMYLKELQRTSEEIRIEDNLYEVIKAPRQGSTEE